MYQSAVSLDFGDLIWNLLVTAAIYAPVPLLFAAKRNKPIKKGKYRLLCIGINCLVFVVLAALQVTTVGVAWCFWTLVWCAVGIHILRNNCWLDE